MNLHSLKPAHGSVHKAGKRVGRGQGSGKGGTARRGHNGAKSRSGYSKKLGFEGGQMPLQRRIPKFGFKNINRKEYVALNLDRLQEFVDKKIIKDAIDSEMLVRMGFLKRNEMVKILGNGELKATLKVSAHKFSASAKAAIEKAGGEAILV